jgi:glycosyltransferase involved in cell wall biosynthesis
MTEFYLIFLFVSFLFFVAIKVFSIWSKKTKQDHIRINEVSIVIPFRNEAKNLPHLLKSIAEQESFPHDLIFVNDHSIDNSEHIVQAFIEKHNVGQLLTLAEGLKGKKAALNHGIQLAKTRFILTLDADVILNKDYIKTLSSLPAFGLSALPVLMNGKGLLGRLFSTEYSFFNAFNFLISPIWPISVSGANLLFDSKAIDYEGQLKMHQHLASGDDYFLLKNFRKNNIPIHVNNDHKLSVETDAPSSLIAYFNQRVRWLSKSKYKMDWVDSVIGFFILIYFIGGFIALIIAAFQSEWILLISIFILRFLIDSLVYLNYGQRLRVTINVVMLPFFQLIYPLLFAGVAVLSLFYKPNWKGRR